MLFNIQQSSLDQPAIRHVQSLLPEDAELDRWLEQAAADYAGDEFICLVVAAIGAGREVHARHLTKGAVIFAAADMLPEVGMKMTGDVPEYLMQANRDSFLSHRGRAYSLAVVAVMHKQRGEEVPPGVHSMVRTVAHLENLEPDALPALLGLAMYLQDEELQRFLRRRYYSRDSEASWRSKRRSQGGERIS